MPLEPPEGTPRFRAAFWQGRALALIVHIQAGTFLHQNLYHSLVHSV